MRKYRERHQANQFRTLSGLQPGGSLVDAIKSVHEKYIKVFFKMRLQVSINMKEIVTIQVGGFANFIGSHFWNFQDELLGLAEDIHSEHVFRDPFLDMDVLYRTGEMQQGVLAYTPRLISIDHQGSLGSIRSSGSLYEKLPSSDPSHVATWGGDVSRHVSEPHEKNLFLQSLDVEQHEKGAMNAAANSANLTETQVQDGDLVDCLEKGVQYWTDFSKVHFHPRSHYELNCLWMGAQEFDNYGSGREILAGGLQLEEINERLRYFVEDCDHMQGIQLIVDDSGGFSGIASEYLEYIVDEYAQTPILLYGARKPITSAETVRHKNSIVRALHDATSFSKLSSLCSLFVPIGLPCLTTNKLCNYLHIEDAKPFHSSAIYAAALHSISLPVRMVTAGTFSSTNVFGATNLGNFMSMLVNQGRQNNVAVIDIAMPAPPVTGVCGSIPASLHSLTPEVAEDTEDRYAVELTTVSGAVCPGGSRASLLQVKESVDNYYQSSEVKPIFTHLSMARCPLPIPLPFPKIFGNRVGSKGELLDCPLPEPHPRGPLDVHSMPTAARLRSSNAILPFVQKRLSDIRRFGTDRGAIGLDIIRRWGFQKDDVQDMAETLSRMTVALDPHSEGTSDSE